MLKGAQYNFFTGLYTNKDTELLIQEIVSGNMSFRCTFAILEKQACRLSPLNSAIAIGSMQSKNKCFGSTKINLFLSYDNN